MSCPKSRGKANDETRSCALFAEQRLTEGLHFFLMKDGGSERTLVELPIDATKSRTDYYRVRVDSDGRIMKVERVHRECWLPHEYSYWENGELREARYAGDSGPVTVEHYDREGKQISAN